MSAKSEKPGLACLILLLAAGCQRTEAPLSPLLGNPAAVTQERLLGAATTGSQWITPGGSWSAQRFSRLRQINAGNVALLTLAWSRDLPMPVQQIADPLFIDGVLYVPVDGSGLLALDAASGATLWQHAADATSGIAAWQGRIFVALQDGRLVALDARNGKELWSTASQMHAAITMGPQVAQGMVFIGATAQGVGARSSVAAFDAATGREIWRFHTVPHDPAKGFENEAMQRAATTWRGEWWNAQTGVALRGNALLDPATGYLVFGTGSAGSDTDAGAGSRLFSASIVALKADSGEYVWHFQVAPGESGVASATAPLMSMDVLLGGIPRHVLVQANVNGQIYMLDVATGELLGADSYANARRAGSVDGRAAFSPATRLAYISTVPGSLSAWNPVGRKLAWEVPARDETSAGGLLATAGGLVFSAADHELRAHDARTGQGLWRYATKGLTASPISFEQGGRQYIAVSMGSAGAAGTGKLLVFSLGDAVKLDHQKH